MLRQLVVLGKTHFLSDFRFDNPFTIAPNCQAEATNRYYAMNKVLSSIPTHRVAQALLLIFAATILSACAGHERREGRRDYREDRREVRRDDRWN